MNSFFHSRSFHIGVAVLMIVAVIFMISGVRGKNNVELITSVANIGSVKQIVSVSGTAEAEQTAELAFPVTGIVKKVSVKQGDLVEAGDILVELETRALEADRQDAIAALNKVIADRNELIAGPSTESRTVTDETVALKEDILATTITNETNKVDNAYRALLSTSLEALSKNLNEDAEPPTVTGTYICDEEGTYTLTLFSSGAESGYSYTYSGLESGTAVASTNQASPLGECGVYIQFDENSIYNASVWSIAIPNKKSASYVANVNAYNLAKSQAESAISLAEQDVTLARASASNSNAPARAEALARANANVEQANARLERINSTIADRIIRAPFAGTITEIDILPGETVTTVPVVTLLADKAFDVTALIPEIDIGKLSAEQRVEMVFDARSEEIITGTVSFISLKAKEIDGVSYYEAIIEFDTVPDWIRSGLNADVDIIVSEVENVLRVPSRFVYKNGSEYVVQKKAANTIATTTVTIVLDGDDGWIAITGINDGDTVVAR